MNAVAARAWQAARALVGVPYRLHGRRADHGLDCVGLVALAYDRAGLHFAPPPVDYRMRHAAMSALSRPLVQAGFAIASLDAIAPGSIIIQRWPSGGLHMLVATPEGAVHAHAGLRKIVETPDLGGDHVVAVWHLPEGS